MSWDPISRLLFPAPPPSYGPQSFPQELIFVPKSLDLQGDAPKDDRIPCLLLKCPSARFVVLYLHSNAEDLGKCYGFCHVLRVQFQVHVLAVEYPGYGICPGAPATADSVTENAFACFRFVREVLKWPLDSIKVLGRSIGTGPAVALAVQYRVAGLILIAPFLSIKDIVRDIAGSLSHLVMERFPSKDRIHLVRSPALIIHGQKDSLIACRHGAALYRLCRSRKLLVCPESMEHNTCLLSDPGYLAVPMLQFFSLPDYSFQDVQVPSWVFPFPVADGDTGDGAVADLEMPIPMVGMPVPLSHIRACCALEQAAESADNSVPMSCQLAASVGTPGWLDSLASPEPPPRPPSEPFVEVEADTEVVAPAPQVASAYDRQAARTHPLLSL